MISGLAPGLLFNDLKDHKEPAFLLCRFSFSNLIAIRREIFLKRKKNDCSSWATLIKLSHCAYYQASGLHEAFWLLGSLGVCTLALLPTSHEMTDVYTETSMWTARRVTKKMLRSRASCGSAGGGIEFFCSHPAYTPIMIKPKPPYTTLGWRPTASLHNRS